MIGLAANSLDAAGPLAAAGRIAVCTLAVAYLVTAATGLGLLFMKAARMRAENPWERLVLAAGLGLGALSLLVLGLGLLGMLTPVFWIVLLGLLIAGSARQWVELYGELRSDVSLMRPKGWFEYWVAALLVAVFIANFVSAFAPPLDYDVLEYHLAAPAQYLSAGRVFFISDNVYANFPENVEMLYLLLMKVCGGELAGAYAGNVLNAVLGVLAAVGVWRVGARLFSRKAGAVAAAIFYSAPWMPNVTQKQYVETGLVLYGVLSMLVAARYWMGPAERGSWREAAAGGGFAGLAVGVKYPAALFVAIPLILFFILANLKTRRAVRHSTLCLFVAAAVASPWLVKNYVHTGNPSYPLLYGIYDGRNWDGLKAARFGKAHSPSGMGRAEFAESFSGYFSAGELASPLLLVFVPFFLFYPGKWKERIAVLLYAAFVFAAWFLFTHRIERFLIPILPAVALLAACGVESNITRWWYRLCRVLFSALIAYCVFVTLQIDFEAVGYHRVALGMESPREYVRRICIVTGSSYSPSAIDFVNRIPADQNVLFVGEARTFYVRRPVIAPTVFDAKLMDQIPGPGPEGRAFWELLRANSIDYIYLNLPELMRLQSSYAFEYAGARQPGYSEWLDMRILEAMAGKYLLPVRAFPLEGATGGAAFVIFRVLGAEAGAGVGGPG